MTGSWRNGIRAVAAAAVLLAGAACQKQQSGGRASSGQPSGSSGPAQQGSSAQRSSSGSSGSDQGSTSTKQAEGPKAAGAEQTAQRTVTGRVVRAGQEEIVVRQGTGDEPDLRLKVGPQTKVTVDGRQRSVGDLQEGTQVRASYDESGGAPEATRIEAVGGGNL